VPPLGTPFWNGIESFWNKVSRQLPRAVLAHYQKYRRVFHVVGMPAKSYASKHGFLKTLHRAILEHRVVEADYQPPGRPVESRRMEPYAIVFYQSSLYVVAAAHEIPRDQNRLRHWKLDRFHRVTILDARFERVEDTWVREHVGRGVGIFSGGTRTNVRIRISPRAASWVTEDPWHPDQTVKATRDGGVELTVPATHDLEIIPRVLALGGEAEVLAPASYRQAIAGVIRQMAKLYPEA
jgi:predicted DNA-binding transcriptional regulator YafY